MKHYSSLLLFIALVLTFASLIRSQSCVPTNNPSIVKIESLATTTAVTFDDLGLVDRGNGLFAWRTASDGPRSVSSNVNQSITLSGHLGINNAFLWNGLTKRGDYLTWDGSQYWTGSSTDKPGFYFYADGGGFGSFAFSPPISAVAAKVAASDQFDNSWVSIFDVQGNLIECQVIPVVPSLTANKYRILGFISPIPIGSVRFSSVGSGFSFFVDDIQYVSCDEGYYWNGAACVDVDECTLFNPCGDHATCNNTVGSYLCTCDDGYDKLNGTECVDIDECTTLSPCSQFATCTNNNGSFGCECNEGYSGTGLGQNGCQAIQTPLDNNSPSSSGSPSGIQPSNSNPNTPSSRITSSSDSAHKTSAYVLTLILSISVHYLM